MRNDPEHGLGFQCGMILKTGDLRVDADSNGIPRSMEHRADADVEGSTELELQGQSRKLCMPGSGLPWFTKNMRGASGATKG
jgi:hypothetical protein